MVARPTESTEIHRTEILLELLELRERQDGRLRHSEEITALEWVNAAVTQFQKAGRAPIGSPAFRRRILRAAGFLVATVESIDREQRSRS